MSGHRARALERDDHDQLRTSRGGTVRDEWQRLWKRRADGNRGKVQSTDFPSAPTALGNPAHPGGFPLSHSPDYGCLSAMRRQKQKPQTGQIMCYKNRTSSRVNNSSHDQYTTSCAPTARKRASSAFRKRKIMRTSLATENDQRP